MNHYTALFRRADILFKLITLSEGYNNDRHTTHIYTINSRDFCRNQNEMEVETDNKDVCVNLKGLIMLIRTY